MLTVYYILVGDLHAAWKASILEALNLCLQHHHIKREEVRIVDTASKNRELKIKEALYIQMTPDNKFNRDIGLELPGCWLSMLRAKYPP